MKQDIIALREGAILRRLAQLEEGLVHLSYEGKLSLGKNLSNASHRARDLQESLTIQFAMEEKRLFPFLARHIPKLEPALLLFEAEHREIRAELRAFASWLKIFSRRPQDPEGKKAASKVREVGTYVIYFLRNHFQAERHILEETARRALRTREKKELCVFTRDVTQKDAANDEKKNH